MLEIDLLRRGKRPSMLTPLPDSPYFLFLKRADGGTDVEIWPVSFKEAIPLLPVPLRHPDPAIPLDLNQAIQTVYNEAAYDLRLDYSQPPPKPNLSADDMAWLEAHLSNLVI